jgi:hypothetical protein
MSKIKRFKTNEMNEAVNSLEMIEVLLPRVIADVYFWKWIIIGFHHTLHYLMISALKGGSGMNLLEKKHAVKMTNTYKLDSCINDDRKADPFIELYDRIKSSEMDHYVHSTRFTAGETEDDTMAKIRDLRNDLTLFSPRVWFLDLKSFPRMTRDALRITEFLVFESNNILFSSDRIPSKIKGHTEKIKKELTKIETKYRAEISLIEEKLLVGD